MAKTEKKRGRPPGLTPAQMERVRRGLRKVKSEFGSDAATARAIGLSGKSHAVQRILAEETGASMATAKGIAVALKVTIEALLSGRTGAA